MTNKGISEIPLFDPVLLKMDCPLFGVTTVIEKIIPPIFIDPATQPLMPIEIVSLLFYWNFKKLRKCARKETSLYECSCIDGFDGDGFNCTDINECIEKENACSDQGSAKYKNSAWSKYWNP